MWLHLYIVTNKSFFLYLDGFEDDEAEEEEDEEAEDEDEDETEVSF